MYVIARIAIMPRDIAPFKSAIHGQRIAVIASPGVDGMAFLVPVRPGDQLSLRAEITEVRSSKSKPDRGIVRGVISVINQEGVTVMTKQSKALFKRRPEA